MSLKHSTLIGSGFDAVGLVVSSIINVASLVTELSHLSDIK